MMRCKQVFDNVWLYPVLIVLSVLAASLVTFVYPDIAVRSLLIMGFLCVCPGLTVVRFFHLNEIMIEWSLVIALSIAIDAFIAGVLLYAGRWSPVHILIALLGFCFVGAILMLFKSVTR